MKVEIYRLPAFAETLTLSRWKQKFLEKLKAVNITETPMFITCDIDNECYNNLS